MKKKYMVTCFIAVFFMSAIQAKATPESSVVEPDYQSFVAAHAFPYVAPAPRTDQIIQNYGKLTIGLRKESVAALIGGPDCAEGITSKTGPSALRGWIWEYYFEKPDPNLVNEKRDILLHVVFDQGGVLVRIHSNVPGLKSIGM